LYHYVDNKRYDRTVIVKPKIAELVKELEEKESYFIAESWLISFEDK